MTKRRLDVGIEGVNEVYDGAGGILWEMLMGEQIHVGGAPETDILAEKAGIRDVVLVREMTKIYQEVIKGTINEVIFKIKSKPPRGEYVILFNRGGKNNS